MKREPWRMVCPCGAEFFTACYTTFYCPECREKRKKESQRRCNQTEKGRERNRRAAARKRAKDPEKCNERTRRWRRENREAINAYKRKQYAEHREDILHATRLRYHARRGDKRAQFELAKRAGRVLYCERLKVTAPALPCGTRDECWWGKPCDRVIQLGITKPKELFRPAWV